MKNFKNWLDYRRHRYDVFEKLEADLIERVVSLGYVLLDDEYSYKICREYDERTCIVQFPRSFVEDKAFIRAALDALGNEK